MPRLAVRVDLDSGQSRSQAFADVQAADEAGVEAVFVPEAWGRDAFSTLVQIADRTRRITVGTGIVNVFSRAPAALAQQFATLDELSEGRAIAGLGTSGALVVEQFHGVPFARPATRLREVIQILRLLIAGQPLRYEGDVFRFERGFTLRFTPVRRTIPVYLASFRPAGVRLTAELADGWLPMMIPLERLPDEVARFRALVAAGGRDPSSVVVRSPGEVVVTDDVDAVRTAHKRRLAYYLARMGDFYHTQLSDMGWREPVAEIRRAWEAGGSAAGAAAVPDALADAFAAIGSVEQCRARIAEQAAAGVDLHQITVLGIDDPAARRRVYERLGQ
ncbi:MAG: LLM class flavin-dependent oxidoreductase [Chloroflexi bacterium]|nr:LLM class flavin-dependent oxidoreductase [Chloroflexota bacterium]